MIWDRLPEWMRSNIFYHSKQVEFNEYDSSKFLEDESKHETSITDANLVSSNTGGEFNGETVHYPALDLDIPVALIPSSTPGHNHLYINRALTWEQYFELLTVLEKCGIIQTGVLQAAEHNKETCLRPPWVSKPDDSELVF